MSLKNEFRKMITELAAKFTFPPIENIFFPPFYKGGQPKDAQFMAVSLEGGATGISFVLLPGDNMEEYTALQPTDFIEKNPLVFAFEFGRPLLEKCRNALYTIFTLPQLPLQWRPQGSPVQQRLQQKRKKQALMLFWQLLEIKRSTFFELLQEFAIIHSKQYTSLRKIM